MLEALGVHHDRPDTKVGVGVVTEDLLHGEAVQLTVVRAEVQVRDGVRINALEVFDQRDLLHAELARARMPEVQVVGRKRLVALVGRRFHGVPRVAPDLEGVLRPLLIELVVVDQARLGYGIDELADHRVDVGVVIRKPLEEGIGIVAPRLVP